MTTPTTTASGPVSVEQVSCPDCGADHGEIVAAGPDFDNHACGDQEFTLVRCGACGTWYLNPRPTSDMLPVIYDAERYYAYSFSNRGNPVVLAARARRDQQKIAQILEQLPNGNSSPHVLDIGAGDGALLDAFRNAGVPAHQLSGLDLEPGAVDRLRSRGYRAYLGCAEQLDFETGAFDVVTMIQVIEHVANPGDVLSRIHRALTPGGVVVLETPNLGSWDRRFFAGRTWGGYHFPRHWTLWDEQGLRRLLAKRGFEVVGVATPAAAVTWTWSVNHVLQDLRAPRRLAEFFSLSNPLALGFFWAIDLVPSLLRRSANLRVIARSR